MRSRTLAISGLIVLVLSVLAAFLLLPDEDSVTEDAGPTAAEQRKAIAKKKRLARADGFDSDPVRLTGRVTAEDGTPVPGALVLLTAKSFAPAATPPHARTDAGGGFALEGIEPGRYTLSASARGFLPALDTAVRVVAGQDNGGHRLTLTAGGHTVRGVVSDVGGGTIGGALVSITRLDDGNVMRLDRTPAGVLTDDEGRFETTLPNGSYMAAASHPDYVQLDDTFDVSGGARVLDFALTPAATVEGVVLARDTGEPVAGAIVVAHGEEMQAAGGFSVQGFGKHRVVAGDDGRFRMQGLGSGVFELKAAAAGHTTRNATQVALSIAQSRSGVEIYVDPAHAIRGFVVPRGDEEDGALEGVWVGALSFRPPGLFVARAPTEADGYFEIPGVEPGSYMVAALGEETLPNFTGTGVDVEDGDVEDVLVVMDRGVTIRGRVEPPSAATVSIAIEPEGMGMSGVLSAMSNAFVRTRASAAGTFELHPVGPGDLTVQAEAEDGSRGEIDVEVGEDGVEELVIRLEPRAQISGRVVDAHGKPVSDAKVVATRVDGDAPQKMSLSVADNPMIGGGAPTGEDGSFALRGLDPGEYEVSVNPKKGGHLQWATPTDPEQPAAPIAMTVEGAGPRDVTLTVEARDGVIRGAVVDVDGAPVADAWVTAQREGAGKTWLQQMARARTRRGHARRREARMPPREADAAAVEAVTSFAAERPVLTDDNGRFEIGSLREGRYILVAEARRGANRVRLDSVALGSDVTLHVAAVAAIEGKVSGAERFTVTLEGTTPRTKQVFSKTGKFMVDRIDPGAYTVKVVSDDGVGEVKVEVEAGERVTADVELDAFGTLRGKVVAAGTGEAQPGLVLMAHPEGGQVDPSAGLSLLMGGAPRTGSRGAFEIDRIPPGKGTLLLLDMDATQGARGSVRYELDPGEDLDLGTVTAVAAGAVAMDKRGRLGLKTTVRNWTERPRVGDEEDAEPPADPERERLWVRAVDIEGPADAAGVEPGDEVVVIGDQEVAGLGPGTAEGLLSPAQIEAGSDMTLELRRDGSPVRVTVTAAPRG